MAREDGQIKPGQVLNPGGRPKLPDDIKAARQLSHEEMMRTVIEIRGMTPEEVVNLDMNKQPLGKRAIMNAYAKLDYRGIKEYEDRLWGKAVESIDLSGSIMSKIIYLDKQDEGL